MLPYWLTQLIFDGQLRWRMWRHGMSHREALLDLLHLEEEVPPSSAPATGTPAADAPASAAPPRTESAAPSTTAPESPDKLPPAPAPQSSSVAQGKTQEGGPAAARDTDPPRYAVDAAKAKRMREFGRMLLVVRTVLEECSARFSRHCLDCRLMHGQTRAAVQAVDELFTGLGYEPERIAKVGRQPELHRFLERTRQEAVRFEAECERTDGEAQVLSAMAKSTAEERMQTSRALHRFHAWLRKHYQSKQLMLRIFGGNPNGMHRVLHLRDAEIILCTFEEVFPVCKTIEPPERSDVTPALLADGLDAAGLDAMSLAFLRGLRARVEAKTARRAATDDEEERIALAAEIEELEWVQCHYWHLFTQLTETGHRSG